MRAPGLIVPHGYTILSPPFNFLRTIFSIFSSTVILRGNFATQRTFVNSCRYFLLSCLVESGGESMGI